jgi:hypothetical protein
MAETLLQLAQEPQDDAGELLRLLHVNHVSHAGDDNLLRSDDLVGELVGESELVGNIVVADHEQGRDTDLSQAALAGLSHPHPQAGGRQ